MRLILASASPRRRELLKKITPLPFEVQVSHAEEVSGSVPYVALINSQRKAEDIANRAPDAIVIGADTVVELDGAVIGKPADLADARRILRLLSGKTHTVATGVTILWKEVQLAIQFEARTAVRFRSLSDADIEKYLSLVHVLDKAGAYGIQEHGDLIVESIDGSFDNVMGLPTERLKESLDHIQACLA